MNPIPPIDPFKIDHQITPIPPTLAPPPRSMTAAASFFERIQKQIGDFLLKLPPDEDITVDVILHDGKRIRADWFGYHGQDMLIIEGLESGARVRCLMAPSNIEIVFSVFKTTKNSEKKIIGFQRSDQPEKL